MKLFDKYIWIIIAAIGSLFETPDAEAQIYYSDITKEKYNQIVSGQMFYPAKILYNNNEVEEGFVARYNDSDLIRFKKSMDNQTTRILSPRHIKSFMYGNEEWGYPQYIYKNIDLSKRKRRPKIRALEVVSKGEIMIYINRWVELPEYPRLPFSKAYCSMNTQFYLEKNNQLYIIENWNHDIKDLIKDKEEVFMEYKKNYRKKYRDTSDYKNFINLINMYNETECKIQ